MSPKYPGIKERVGEEAMRSLTIKAPKYLNEIETEKLLIKYHLLSQTTKDVEFNFNATRWASPYCLSLILVWMREISVLPNHTVSFRCPAHNPNGSPNPEGAPIQSFLGLWGYWNALEKLCIEGIASEAERSLRRPLADFSDKCVPFHFFESLESLEKFIGNFDLGSALSEVVGSSCYIGDIGSAGVSSVILYELGKNLVEHGKGQAAHMTIGVTPRVGSTTASELQKKLHARSKSVPKYAHDFYRALGNRRCLELVLSDQGPGIQEKLRGPYLQDPILRAPMKQPTSVELLKYAFMMHSTSKIESWYFDVDTGRSPEQYKPPRGLYFVKNIARRNNALLTCRSGDALIAYDFLSKENGVYHTNASDPRMKTIAPLAGTQIKVLIPLPERPRVVQIPVNTRFEAQSEISNAVWIDLAAYKGSSVTGNNFDSRVAVQALHALAHANRKDALIIVDFLNVRPAKEHLYPVISEVQHLGLANHKFVLTNCYHLLSDIVAMASEDYTNDKSVQGDTLNWQKKRPMLICYSEPGGTILSITGIPSTLKEGLQNITESLLRGESVPNTQVPHFLDNLVVSSPNGNAHLVVAPLKILQTVSSYNRHRLQEMMDSPELRIRHEGKFLFPSLVYSERFYEIGAALENEDVKNRLLETLLDAMDCANGSSIQILSLSSIGAQLVELIVTSTKKHRVARHVNSLSPDIPISALLDLDRKHETMLLVDVIATGQSVERALRVCENYGLNVTRIVAVVDIRPSTQWENQIVLENRHYDLVAIVRNPTPLFRENRPPSWAWSDIQRVDADSWRLLKAPDPPEKLWSTEAFLSAAIRQSGGIAEGHFFGDSTQKHFAYFFVTQEICQKFGEDIAAKVDADVRQFISANSKELVAATHVVVPKSTSGIHVFADSLARRLGASVVKVLTEPALIDLERNEPIDCAVVLDSALSTGETIWDLLDIVAERGARGAYICVIMNRAPSRIVKRFRAVRQYHETVTAFRNVVELPIHAFINSASCPICEKRKTLSETRRLFRSPEYDRVVERVMSATVPIAIDTIDPKCFSDGDAELMNALEARILIRARIQNAKDNDNEAWQQILNLCEHPTLLTRDTRSLVEVLYRERAYFSNDKQLFPPEFRVKLFAVCLELIRAGDGLVNEAAAVAVAFEPALLLRKIPEIIAVLASDSEAMYRLYMELASLRYSSGDTYFANTLTAISGALQRLDKDGSARPELFELIFDAERALTCLGIDTAKATETENRKVKMFREVFRALNDRRPTELHEHIRELWTFIAGMSFEKANDILDKFYFAEDGFAALALKKLLPNLLSLCEDWAPIVRSQYAYLWEQLDKDLQLLHENAMRLRILLAKGLLDVMEFEEIWDKKSFVEARKRILNNVIEPGGQLRAFLLQRLCEPTSVLEQVVCNLRTICQEQGIKIAVEVETPSATDVFCGDDTLRSILSNVCVNVVRHAYPGPQGYIFKEVVISTFMHDSRYVIRVSDNGVGMSRTDKERLTKRLQKKLGVYEGTALVFVEGGTRVELGFFVKGDIT